MQVNGDDKGTRKPSNGFISLLPSNFVREITEDIKKYTPQTLLDLGCEDGLMSYELANLMPKTQIICTSDSPDFINFLNKSYSHPNLNFMIMDATKNVFLNHFELVVSYNGLTWTRDQKKVLQGIKESLLPEGEALLHIPLINKLDMFIELIGLHPRWRCDFPVQIKPRIFFTKNEYLSLITQVGLKVVFSITNDVIYILDEQQISSLFLKKFPHLYKLSEKRKNEFFHHVITSLAMHSISKTAIEFFVPTLKVCVKRKND